MSRNTSQKRGLALGAVFALVASIFTAAPAQADATNGANIAIRPVQGTTFGGMVYNDFDLYAQLLPGQTNSSFSTGVLMWKVDVTSGFKMDVSYRSSAAADDGSAWTSASSSVGQIASSGSATSKSFDATVSSGVSYLTLKVSSASAEATSWSSVTMTVTAWIDEITAGASDGVRDADEWFTTQTVTLYNMAGLSVTNNWTAPNALDRWVTASATIAGVNFANVDGKFFLAVSSSQNVFGAGTAAQQSSSPVAGATLALRSGVLSSSWAISPISESQSVSFQVRYVKSGDAGTYTDGFGRTVTAYAATVPGVDTLSISATANANITGGGTAYTIRPNQTYTIRVTAASSSTSVSKAVTVTLGGTALVTSSKLLSINGGAFVTAYPAAGITVTTGTNGVGTFTLGTSGFVAGDTLTVDANVGNVSPDLVTFTVAAPTYTVVADQDLVATAPGTAVNLGFTVEDQWGELSAATNQYLKVTRGGTGFNYATTVSYHAVAAGAATVAFTPAPATTTGSATVVVDITKLENGAYITDGVSDSVTVTVTSKADAFGSGLAASRAASVSYFPSTVSWVTVTGNVTNSGSVVKVTGDSTLVFRGATVATFSGAVTVYADSTGQYSFEVAALRSGDKTITLTNGTATTTSLIVVADAASDLGRTISWDTTTVESGKTRVITGTITDANGNPVDTTGVGSAAGDSGTASIVVTYTGTAGIVVGTMPTETDADGKFKVSVLTAAADSGTLTLTAVYMPQGASTVTAKKVTSVQAVTVAPAAAPEVNAVIGSFNGRWAVRVENAKGSVVSVKAGNRWVKFTSLNNNYLFSRKSVVGRTIAISVWVDGELQNSQTITIK
jgi:hypothetical protein